LQVFGVVKVLALVFLVLSFFWRLPDALCTALIVLYLVIYAVLACELVVVDIADAVAVGATLGVVVGVSGVSPGSYKLKGSEQLTADRAAFLL
jgi:hypothetical protein